LEGARGVARAASGVTLAAVPFAATSAAPPPTTQAADATRRRKAAPTTASSTSKTVGCHTSARYSYG
jgi:hypothetical protein